MIALFDHEEVGSKSATGAEGPLLRDSISRIWAGLAPESAAIDPYAAAFRARSFHLSSDMAHAVHPNYAERHDKAHGPKLGEGLVLKHNANQRYATDAVAAAFVRRFGSLAGEAIQVRPLRHGLVTPLDVWPIYLRPKSPALLRVFGRDSSWSGPLLPGLFAHHFARHQSWTHVADPFSPLFTSVDPTLFPG